MWLRLCERCGRLDLRERYESAEEADASGVWERPWACQECESGDFVLVEDPPLSGNADATGRRPPAA